MIAAVLLAAGGSTRMGRAKQLIDREGRPMVRRAAEAALDAGCRPVLVVVGAEERAVGDALDAVAVEPVVNRGWREGIGSSIRIGIERLDARAPDCEAVILFGCDQPHLEPAVLARLIESFRLTGERSGRRVACAYGGTVGTPALFERTLFGELAKLGGDRGARKLLLDEPARTLQIPWDEGAIDLDRPEDLARLRGSER